jgi:hypothetical protein
MTMTGADRILPGWLATYDAFTAHLDERLVDETPHRKGLRFVRFALAILPCAPVASGFEDFELNSHLGHDHGVDILTALNSEGRQLFAQPKFHLKRTDDVDTIVKYIRTLERAPVGSMAGWRVTSG